MSWFARSLTNSLNLNDEEDERNPNPADSISSPNPQFDHDAQSSSPSSTTTPRGVKEDLSELTKTLTRQFWGVASFLAPPSDSSSSRPISDVTANDPQLDRPLDPEESNEDLISGIRSDFAEIGGRFKSGISKLSTNVAVSEITKIASNLLQLGSDRDLNDEGLIGSAVGVTEGVVFFVRDISMHPETWLDFPIPDENFDDFDMSDAQQEHAVAVERLAPRLTALRTELCPGYMSEGCFWKIYFVLLHPRLSKDDAELLSTPGIVEARAMLSHELQNRTKGTNPSFSGSGTFRSQETADLPREDSVFVPSPLESEQEPLKTSNVEVKHATVSVKTPANEDLSSGIGDELETEKHPIQSTKNQIVAKAVIEEEPVSHTKHQVITISTSKIPEDKLDDEADDWLKEECSETMGTGGAATHIANDEDVSFSDLEEDDEDVPINYKDIKSVNTKEAGSEQVRAHNSESRESDDWLDVDYIDVL